VEHKEAVTTSSLVQVLSLEWNSKHGPDRPHPSKQSRLSTCISLDFSENGGTEGQTGLAVVVARPVQACKTGISDVNFMMGARIVRLV